MKVKYVENYKGGQFALLTTRDLDSNLYVIQKEDDITQEELENLIDLEIDEIKEFIKNKLINNETKIGN